MILRSSGHILPPDEVGFVLLPNELFKNCQFSEFLDLGMADRSCEAVFTLSGGPKAP